MGEISLVSESGDGFEFDMVKKKSADRGRLNKLK